jgi:hypothetical protein
MTGGQPVEGRPDVIAIAHQVKAEEPNRSLIGSVASLREMKILKLHPACAATAAISARRGVQLLVR